MTNQPDTLYDDQSDRYFSDEEMAFVIKEIRNMELI